MQSEVWVDAADAIEVRIFDESEQTLGIFRVNAGEWTSIHDELASILADSLTGATEANENLGVDTDEWTSGASERDFQ